jgi:phosphate starvation-inducible PhoH-like protein
MVMPINEEGGEQYAVLTVNEEYHVPTVVPLIHMLSSKEKRKARRQVQERENHSRGMDILPFYPKTDRQEDLWTSLNKNTVTIAIGSAGVGKTLVGLWWGLTQIASGKIDRIYYVRSDVGCSHQRGRGALPGTMEEKIAPLVGPVYDNLSVMTRSEGAADYLLTKKIVHPVLLEDLRGRSFNDCLILFDEAQNSNKDQCKTVLSRVGENSKVMLTGDTRQIDLEVFSRDSGLLDAFHRLRNIKGVGTVQFSPEDIVRNGIIADILGAYEN